MFVCIRVTKWMVNHDCLTLCKINFSYTHHFGDYCITFEQDKLDGTSTHLCICSSNSFGEKTTMAPCTYVFSGTVANLLTMFCTVSSLHIRSRQYDIATVPLSLGIALKIRCEKL